MKKTISIFITSVILAMSVFSVNAFASTTKTEEFLNRINESSEASVTISSSEEEALEAFGMNANNRVAFKEDSNFIEFNFGMISFRMLSTGDSTYIYLPKFPLYYLKADRIFGVDITSREELLVTINLPDEKYQFVSTYEENGYYVDEYIDGNNNTVKYYYSGDELKYVITVYSDGSSYTLIIEDFSFDVDDDDFSPPKFALDLTFLLGFLALMF